MGTELPDRSLILPLLGVGFLTYVDQELIQQVIKDAIGYPIQVGTVPTALLDAAMYRPEPPPPVPDGVVITNPAVATTTVAYAITNYTLQGTAGTNLSGVLMSWTNALSGQSGTLTRETYWSLPSALAVGDNVLTVAGVIAGTGAGTSTVAVDSATAYSNETLSGMR